MYCLSNTNPFLLAHSPGLKLAGVPSGFSFIVNLLIFYCVLAKEKAKCLVGRPVLTNTILFL